jgi:hypothetical protein
MTAAWQSQTIGGKNALCGFHDGDSEPAARGGPPDAFGRQLPTHELRCGLGRYCPECRPAVFPGHDPLNADCAYRANQCWGAARRFPFP